MLNPIYLLLLVSLTASALPSKCASGLPGGMYECPLPAFQPWQSASQHTKPSRPNCNWHPPDTTPCWDYPFAYDADRPRSIGPDGGGSCVFYYFAECKGETLKFDNEMKKLPKGSKEGNERVECPGVDFGDKALAYHSFRCQAN
ncbi:hypothetical protein FB567DRAFT_547360 [Paraphoma chrysanthemicola]|uniref:Uncharacterized protein n=1 Tax=Paraphoma chrysanthemicola TaxID=798071 RepID=A0A8K0RCQ8_9PLEO|nr:hypothetical protein FB567DRAFT_547360 [Paraphoma chrysanthemicola]